jgi:hypothetical protein
MARSLSAVIPDRVVSRRGRDETARPGRRSYRGPVTSDAEAWGRLARAAPSFEPDWDADDPNPYVDVGDLVDHLRDELRAGRTNEVEAVFTVAEDMLVGAEPVANFIQIGLFESIQNTSAGSGVAQEAFERFLGHYQPACGRT